MAQSSSQLHEDRDDLRAETIDRHRAVVSLIEEFDAIDWYQQRIDATDDDQLRAILAHNRDEEREHAVMTLEWLRRRSAGLDDVLHTYLFTAAPIVDLEDDGHDSDASNNDPHPGPRPGDQGSNTGGSLGIGGLREDMS